VRAVWIAISFASEPEFVKNETPRSPGVRSRSFSAKAIVTSLMNRVEVCWTLRSCRTVASVTSSLQWPTETVRIPPKKSRYSLPSTSQTYMPLARSTASGSSP